MITNQHCPTCGSPLHLEEGEVGDRMLQPFMFRGRELPTVWRKVVMAVCYGCEFTIEVKGVRELPKEAA